MAVQILSDLHLESQAYGIFEVVPHAPYLALLGDIGNIVSHWNDCRAFFIRQLRQFRAVLFVPGNHEAYHSGWPETLDFLRTFEQDVRGDASLGEFVLLDRAGYQLPDTNIAILGCSLFSFVPPESQTAVSIGLNDFYQTRDWDVDAHNEAHRRDLAWLNAEVARLEQLDSRIMIFTHWTPSRDPRAIEPRHIDSPIKCAFSTDLSGERCFQSAHVKAWAFGHTHYNCDFEVNRWGAGPLRLLTNQRGYYFAQSASLHVHSIDLSSKLFTLASLSTMPRGTMQPMDSFPFGSLPAEIRRQIWNEALSTRCVLAFHCNYAAGNNMENPSFIKTYVGPAPFLAGLSSREAHQLMEESFNRPLRGPTTPGDHRPIWANLDHTVVFLGAATDALFVLDHIDVLEVARFKHVAVLWEHQDAVRAVCRRLSASCPALETLIVQTCRCMDIMEGLIFRPLTKEAAEYYALVSTYDSPLWDSSDLRFPEWLSDLESYFQHSNPTIHIVHPDATSQPPEEYGVIGARVQEILNGL